MRREMLNDNVSVRRNFHHRRFFHTEYKFSKKQNKNKQQQQQQPDLVLSARDSTEITVSADIVLKDTSSNNFKRPLSRKSFPDRKKQKTDKEYCKI